MTVTARRATNKRVGGVFISAKSSSQTQKTCPEFISGSRTKKGGISPPTKALQHFNSFL